MAQKVEEPDREFLADLADHADELITEFIGLPESERERSSVLLYEIQHVISEFRRLRPPPTFKAVRTLRLVRSDAVCGLCGKPITLNHAGLQDVRRTVYHAACLEGRKPE